MNAAYELAYPNAALPFNGYDVEGKYVDGEGDVAYILVSGYYPNDSGGKAVFFPGKVELPQADKQKAEIAQYKTAQDINFGDGDKHPKFKVKGKEIPDKVLDTSADQHGPSMAAFIGASPFAVARRCRIAPLSRHNVTIKADQANMAQCIECCETILKYHQDNHKEKAAIVNCSFTMTDLAAIDEARDQLKGHEGFTEEDIVDRAVIQVQKFEAAIQKLISAGMVVVFSAGNRKQTMNLSWREWKANKSKRSVEGNFFRTPQCFDNVLIAGGLNRNGLPWEMSGTGKNVSYLLLADRVIDPLDDKIGSGTSISPAFLSGIIACIISNTQVPGKAPWAEEIDKMGRIRKFLDKISSPPPPGSSGRSFLSGKIRLPPT